MTERIAPSTDPADLARIYDELLETCFPDTELVTRSDFISAGVTGELDVLVARSPEGSFEGVIIAERHGAGVLVSWLAVSGTARGAGTGGELYRCGLERWLNLDGVCVIVGEVERPDLFPAHPRYGDPARRLSFYERHGVTVLDMPYYEPPLREGADRLRGLLLVVLAGTGAGSAPRVLSPAETAGVRDVLVATLGPALPGDDETARIYAAVDDPAGLRTLPLGDYASTPVSRRT